jgi:hypothetical protein
MGTRGVDSMLARPALSQSREGVAQTLRIERRDENDSGH